MTAKTSPECPLITSEWCCLCNKMHSDGSCCAHKVDETAVHALKTTVMKIVEVYGYYGSRGEPSCTTSKIEDVTCPTCKGVIESLISHELGKIDFTRPALKSAAAMPELEARLVDFERAFTKFRANVAEFKQAKERRITELETAIREIKLMSVPAGYDPGHAGISEVCKRVLPP